MANTSLTLQTTLCHKIKLNAMMTKGDVWGKSNSKHVPHKTRQALQLHDIPLYHTHQLSSNVPVVCGDTVLLSDEEIVYC